MEKIELSFAALWNLVHFAKCMSHRQWTRKTSKTEKVAASRLKKLFLGHPLCTNHYPNSSHHGGARLSTLHLAPL